MVFDCDIVAPLHFHVESLAVQPNVRKPSQEGARNGRREPWEDAPPSSMSLTAHLEAQNWAAAVSQLGSSEFVEPMTHAQRLQACNSCLSACGRMSCWSQAMALMTGMADLPRLSRPTTVSLAACTLACERAGEWSMVLGLLDYGRREHWLGPKRDEASTANPARRGKPRLMTISAAFRACDRAGRWRDSLRLLPEMLMEGRGYEPTVMTFGNAFQVCDSSRQGALATELFEEMCMRGIRPDTISCNSVIGACASSLLWKEPLDLLSRARAMNLEVTALTATSALKAQRGRWGAVTSLLREFQGAGLQTNSFTVGAALTAWAMDAEDSWHAALGYLEGSASSAVQYTPFSCSAALKACSSSSHWSHALAWLPSCTTQQGADAVVNQNIVADSALAAGHWGLAVSLLAAGLGHRRLCPDAVSAGRLVSAHGGMWHSILTSLEALDAVADPAAKTAAAVELIQQSCWAQALVVLTPYLPPHCTGSLQTEALAAAINALASGSQSDKAFALLDSLSASGIEVSAPLYAAAIQSGYEYEGSESQWPLALSTAQAAAAKGLTDDEVLDVCSGVAWIPALDLLEEARRRRGEVDAWSIRTTVGGPRHIQEWPASTWLLSESLQQVPLHPSQHRAFAQALSSMDTVSCWEVATAILTRQHRQRLVPDDMAYQLAIVSRLSSNLRPEGEQWRGIAELPGLDFKAFDHAFDSFRAAREALAANAQKCESLHQTISRQLSDLQLYSEVKSQRDAFATADAEAKEKTSRSQASTAKMKTLTDALRRYDQELQELRSERKDKETKAAMLRSQANTPGLADRKRQVQEDIDRNLEEARELQVIGRRVQQGEDGYIPEGQSRESKISELTAKLNEPRLRFVQGSSKELDIDPVDLGNRAEKLETEARDLDSRVIALEDKQRQAERERIEASGDATREAEDARIARDHSSNLSSRLASVERDAKAQLSALQPMIQEQHAGWQRLLEKQRNLDEDGMCSLEGIGAYITQDQHNLAMKLLEAKTSADSEARAREHVAGVVQALIQSLLGFSTFLDSCGEAVPTAVPTAVPAPAVEEVAAPAVAASVQEAGAPSTAAAPFQDDFDEFLNDLPSLGEVGGAAEGGAPDSL
eukprot:s908_g5.t1